MDNVTGLNQFLSIFGNITLNKIIVFVLALIFCWKLYLQVKSFFDNKKELLLQKHEIEKTKDEKLQIALDEVAKYPQYREQSRKIQKELKDEINGLKTAQEKIVLTQQQMYKSLNELQKELKDRDKNKLQDRLFQNYRYYTDVEKNPSQSWSEMEAQAFWALFKDYEDMGGNGYMHSVVKPAMKLLKIIDDK